MAKEVRSTFYSFISVIYKIDRELNPLYLNDSSPMYDPTRCLWQVRISLGNTSRSVLSSAAGVYLWSFPLFAGKSVSLPAFLVLFTVHTKCLNIHIHYIHVIFITVCEIGIDDFGPTDANELVCQAHSWCPSYKNGQTSFLMKLNWIQVR